MSKTTTRQPGRAPRPKHRSPLSAERHRLPMLLRHAWYGLNQAFRRRIAHTGLTPDQYTVLRNLKEGDPLGLSQSELTALMSSDPNTIAALVERMRGMGLIERHRHERDGRAHRIRLTAKGSQQYEALKKIASRLQREVLSPLPEAQRRRFLQDLATVAESCRTAADTSGR